MGPQFVDVFYSHRYDPETPLEETLQALVDIVRRGKSIYAGISRWPLEATKFALKYLADRDVPCLLFQDRYNIFDRHVIESGVLEAISEGGCGFVSFSPLAQGLLTNKYLNGIPENSRAARGGHLKADQITPEVVEKIKALNELADKRGESLAQMALSWVLADSRVTSVIVGASSVAQLADSLSSVSAPTFSDDDLSLIDKIAK